MNTCERARLSLKGLLIGDCFGECFMGSPDEMLPKIRSKKTPSGVWRYTDDTQMALSIVENLAVHGEIVQDDLVSRFAEKMEPERGYGVGVFKILSGVRNGSDWRTMSYSGFRGMGSFGNGAAMRVAPLGAYFAEEPFEKIVEQARLSAEVTHAHPEGAAGAIAVAVAAALAWKSRDNQESLGNRFIEEVLRWIPDGYTHEAVQEVFDVPESASVSDAVKILGNGSGITAPDTVPLCLWVVANWSDDFKKALWKTVSALGDRDTTCAIVGGILALSVGEERLPGTWYESCESVSLQDGML
jgi:ADP-ribosylglycohydrolase